MNDLIIIGSGPAGLTAAIYAARAGLKPIILEGNQPGGVLTTTSLIENFPGFENGIKGPDLMQIMKKQAERFGAQFKTGGVTKVEFEAKSCKIFFNEEILEARTILVSTGATAKRLNAPGEDRLWGKGVSVCATCDGYFFRQKTVAVIGGGDSAMEEAHFLSDFAAKVFIVHRRDAFRASEVMVERVKANKKISFVLNKEIQEIQGENKVENLVLKDVVSGEISNLKVDGVFLAVGRKPNTEIFQNVLNLDKEGYILTTDNIKTSIPGVFVAGDCADRRYRQAIVAAGFGAMAAMEAMHWLVENQSPQL